MYMVEIDPANCSIKEAETENNNRVCYVWWVQV